MSISVRCDECGRLIRAPESTAGRTVGCPECRASVRVPDLTEDDHDLTTLSAPDNEDEPVQLVLAFLKSDWRRIPTAMSLWLAIPLFFLPWINVTCSGLSSVVLYHQSGMQSCYGGVTATPEGEELVNGKGNGGGTFTSVGNGKKDPFEDLSPSIISWIYFGVLLLGCFLGFVCILCVVLRFTWGARIGHLLTLLLGCFCVLLLLIAMFIGFPLDQRIKDYVETMRAEDAARARTNPPMNQGNDSGVNVIHTGYAYGLWLSLLVTMISLPFFVIESVLLVYSLTRRKRRGVVAYDTA
jgi:hypothetical protein